MIDLISAVSTTLSLIIAILFAIYCWKLVTYFGLTTKVGKAWIPLFIAGIIQVAISVVAVIQTFMLGPVLPVWWRDFSVDFLRIVLFIAIVAIFHTWKNLGK